MSECPILAEANQEYNATLRVASELMDTITMRISSPSPSVRTFLLLHHQEPVKRLRRLVESMASLGECIDASPPLHIVQTLEELEESVRLGIAECRAPPQQKKRRKRVSVAEKARRARAYGKEWRLLNPMYHQGYTKEGIPMPKPNPVTPAKATSLERMMEERPPQRGGSATRRIPLTSV